MVACWKESWGLTDWVTPTSGAGRAATRPRAATKAKIKERTRIANELKRVTGVGSGESCEKAGRLNFHLALLDFIGLAHGDLTLPMGSGAWTNFT